MKALVTGGSGYLGSHLCKELKAQGWEVCIFDIKLPRHHYFDAFFNINVTNEDAMLAKLALFQPDVVFHLAGRIEVEESNRDPRPFWFNNYTGTCSVINVMKQAGVNKIVFSSTAAVYAPSDISLKESDEIDPSSVYGHTKLHSEHAIAQSGLHYVIFRYFNIAGACPEGDIGELHDPETHLIPCALRCDSFKVFGVDYDTRDGSCIRDYVHVSDVAKAHVDAVQCLFDEQSCILNLGLGQGTSVLEIIEAIRNVTGLELPYEVAARRSGDAASLVADIHKAADIIGYNPKYTLQDIIKTAYNWHIRLYS